MAYADIKLPVLSEESIINGVQEFAKVSFFIADLKKPTYEAMYSVYNGFMCNLLTVTNDQITQIPLYVLETMNRPEQQYLEYAASQLLFVKVLEYLFNACMVRDFTMKDLTSPTRKRTRYLLSQLVNFAQFSVERELDRLEASKKIQGLRANRDHCISKREQLTERINYLKQKRSEDQQKIQAMNLNAMKAEEGNIAVSLLHREHLLDLKTNAVEELRNHLTVKRASKLIRQEQEAIGEKEVREEQLAKKENIINYISEFAPKLLNNAKLIDEEVNKLEESLKSDEKLKDFSVEQSIELKDIETTNKNVHRQIRAEIDKKERMDVFEEKKMSSYQQTNEDCNEKRKATLKELEIKKFLLEVTNKEMQKLKESKAIHEDQLKLKMELMKNTYNQLSQKMSEYIKEFHLYIDEENHKLRKK